MTALDTGTEDLLAEVDDGVAVITMEKRDDRGTPSVETRALQYAARMAVHDVDILIAAAAAAAAGGAAHRAASWLPGAAVSIGDYELLGNAADIMARQRTRQRW